MGVFGGLRIAGVDVVVVVSCAHVLGGVAPRVGDGGDAEVVHVGVNHQLDCWHLARIGCRKVVFLSFIQVFGLLTLIFVEAEA